jgi:hypothetical protein
LKSIFNREMVSILSDLLIDSVSLKGWLSGLIQEAEGNKYVVGQQLRGLFTILVSG